MNLEKETARLYQRFVQMNRHHPPELLRWFVGDVLADFGIVTGDKAPEALRDWLAEQGAEYARIVTRLPFEDALGSLYQQLASHGHRGHLAQYFTPAPIADLMAEIVGDDTIKEADGEDPDRLLRMCEPSCGSGALVLGFLRKVMQRDGPSGARRWSITAIDLDTLCAQICATQVLANMCIGQHALGELVVYAGNALGPRDGLTVVVHASARDLRPDVVLPAMHPSRLVPLRQVVAQRVAAAGGGGASANEVGEVVGATPAPARQKAVARDESAATQVDLFSDWCAPG